MVGGSPAWTSARSPAAEVLFALVEETPSNSSDKMSDPPLDESRQEQVADMHTLCTDERAVLVPFFFLCRP